MTSGELVRIQVYVGAEAAAELSVRARAARRSVSAEAALLVEAGLGGEEPRRAVGADGASSRVVDSSASGSSSPPSPEALSERDNSGDGNATESSLARPGAAESAEDKARPTSRSESVLSHFKPDPKPGRKS